MGEIREKAGRSGVLRTLFFSMLSISACTFGGGFVIVGRMKHRFVEELGWLEEKEMADITALAQATPGAIAVNAAVLLGRRMAGLPGLLAAVAGTVLPPVAILSLVTVFYQYLRSSAWADYAMKGLLAAVAAVILNVAWDLVAGTVKAREAGPVLVLAGAFAASFFVKNTAYILFGAAAAGALSGWGRRKAER